MSQTRTLMLGWEFPPFISGGLGTACYGLTKAMSEHGARIVFVLPGLRPIRFEPGEPEPAFSGREKAELANVCFRTVESSLQPYGPINTAHQYSEKRFRRAGGTTARTVPQLHDEPPRRAVYGPDIHAEVHRYADRVAALAQKEDFDIIHAHDWMTFQAGMLTASQTGKPLVVHVHSTEFDRSGEHVNQQTYAIERAGMHRADRIIAVSNYTKNIIGNRYAVPPGKIDVVYNGVEDCRPQSRYALREIVTGRDKVVLFLGRVTFQKGPDYFLRAAEKVLQHFSDVKFIMAGDGDMLHRCIEMAAELRIAHKVFFTRFLRGDDVHRVYEMADLYVMPSVSEPFGIAPLEALQHDVPVLISRQSGIGETLANALKVDFWDVNELADKMVATLRYDSLRQSLRTRGRREISRFRWEYSAARVLDIYKDVLNTYDRATA